MENNTNDNESDVTLLGRNEETKLLKHKKVNLWTIIFFIIGITMIVCGIITLYYSIYELVLEERLRMRPGLPPYEWWKIPEPEVRLSVFIFEVTNSEKFLNGEDKTLKLNEVGPIIFRENLIHHDIIFHPENSTMSFTATRTAEFLEDANVPGILNRTIIVPNFVMLGIASYLHDAPFFTKIAFNILLSTTKETVFLNTSIYDYLWQSEGPLLRSVKTLLPFMVPVDNVGVLNIIYQSFSDRLNVRIGTGSGHENFFRINQYNYRSTVPGYKPENGDCVASIVNSTEGVGYPQKLTNESVLLYFRKTICRPTPLYFQEQIKRGSLIANKYILRADAFDRLENETADCYKGEKNFEIPDGLSDVSKCYFEFPIVASHPHYYQRAGDWVNKLEGLNPNEKDHASYVIAEPETGLPIDQCARSQSNLYIHKLSGFSNPDYKRFSNSVIPMFWAEYHQADLTPKIYALLKFVVNIVPMLERILQYLLFIVGSSFLAISIIRIVMINSSWKKLFCNKSPQKIIFSQTSNAAIIFEREMFINGNRIKL